MHSSLQAAREAALAKARALIAEGEQTGEDRRGWRVEVMDRANQQVLTVAFSEALTPKAPSQAGGRRTAAARLRRKKASRS